MDIVEFIQYLDGVSGNQVLFYVNLYDLKSQDFPCLGFGSSLPDMVSFFSKDDVVGFLFDKDLFGWKVRDWSVNQYAYKMDEINITLYRFN